MQRNVTFVKKKFAQKLAKDKNQRKVRKNCHFTGKYRGAAHSICNLRFNVLNKFPIVFHNVLNYNYHFIMKELANKFKGKFECLEVKCRKLQNFSVPMEKKN